MDATRIDIEGARPLAVGRQPMAIETPPHSPDTALTNTWSAIHDAGATVGILAGIEPARLHNAVRNGMQTNFAHGQALRDEVYDLADIMQRGIAALLAAHTSGGAPHSAALALWDEFLVERDAIVRLLAPLATCRSA